MVPHCAAADCAGVLSAVLISVQFAVEPQCGGQVIADGLWRGSGLWMIELALCLVIVGWWGALQNETARWFPTQSGAATLPKGREANIVEISNKVFICNKPVNPERSSTGEENTVFASQFYSSISDRIAQNLVGVDHIIKASYIPIGRLFREDFFDSPVDVQLSDPQRCVPNVPDSNPHVALIGRGSGADRHERPDVSRTSFGFAESEIEVKPPAFGTSDNLRLKQRGIGAVLCCFNRTPQQLCLSAAGPPECYSERSNNASGDGVDWRLAVPWRSAVCDGDRRLRISGKSSGIGYEVR